MVFLFLRLLDTGKHPAMRRDASSSFLLGFREGLGEGGIRLVSRAFLLSIDFLLAGAALLLRLGGNGAALVV